MAHFETALSTGMEKAMKSVASPDVSLTVRDDVNKSKSMPELPDKTKLEIVVSNRQDMEAVRSAFEAAVNKCSGGATLTREAYVDTLAAWELMCSAAEDVLELPPKEAETYLLSSRIFPKSRNTGVQLRSVSSWFTNSVPHVMDKYRKVMLKAYFSALSRDWRNVRTADAGQWLHRSAYRTSSHGKAGVKSALEAFFKSTGYIGRIVAARRVGENGHLDCVLGQVSLACAAVRWQLEVRAGQRESGHQGNSQTLHALWREETNAIDSTFPLHNRPEQGIRLIDGADVRRTHTFSEDVVAEHVPSQAGGVMQPVGDSGQNDGGGHRLSDTDGVYGAPAHEAESEAVIGGEGVDDDAAVAAATAKVGGGDDEADDVELLGPESDEEGSDGDSCGIDLPYTAGHEEP